MSHAGVQHTSDRETVAAIEAFRRVDTGRIQAEVVHEAVEGAGRGPEFALAVATLIARRAIVEPAREGESESGAISSISCVVVV